MTERVMFGLFTEAMLLVGSKRSSVILCWSVSVAVAVRAITGTLTLAPIAVSFSRCLKAGLGKKQDYINLCKVKITNGS